MRLIVTSASGTNGDGYGTVLAFTPEGELMGGAVALIGSVTLAVSCFIQLAVVYLNSGPDRILALNQAGVVTRDSGSLDGLDPGGAIFGPEDRLYVTLRRRGTVLALPASLDDQGMALLPDQVVPFPRGICFGFDGRFYLSSGIGPRGEGQNTTAVFSQDGALIEARLVEDPEFSSA